MFSWNSLTSRIILRMMISGSSVFSKSILNMWKFMVHILLKPGLENSEHYFPSVWDEFNCVVFLAFFGVSVELLGIDYFQRAIIGVVLVCVFIWIDVCLCVYERGHLKKFGQLWVVGHSQLKILSLIWCFCELLWVYIRTEIYLLVL